MTNTEQRQEQVINKRALAGLLLIALALLAVAYSRLQLTYDLGFFLPPPQTEEQQLLIERLGQGPGTQLMFVALTGANQQTAEQAANQLRSLPSVTRVLPEPEQTNITALPKVLWRNRLLLGDLPTTQAAWLDVLDERTGDVMFADEDLQTLITGDPALLSLTAIEKATSATSEPRFHQPADPARDLAQQRFLLVQTSTGAFDLDGQRTTVRDIRAQLDRLGIATTRLYGSGVYGVDLQNSVQTESIIFSMLASLALGVLVFLRFRRWLLVLAIGMPLIVGGLTGLATLALLFTKVHGITLAFGFTLLGVALDYPLHLFSHTTQTKETNRVWPTLSLGIASTLTAYGAFALSGTTGMQQLGVFAGSGIFAASIASWWLTRSTDSPGAMPTQPEKPLREAKSLGGKANHLPWCVCLLLGTGLLGTTTLFSDDLSRMTPVPQDTLIEDARIRNAMGVADIRHLISVRQDTLQDTLEHLEKTGAILDDAVAKNKLGGYQNVTALLPSHTLQTQRRNNAQNLLASGAFQRAIEQSDFASGAFDEFSQALEDLADNTQPNLDLSDLQAASEDLNGLLGSMLYNKDGQWVALTYLRALPEFPRSLANELHKINGVQLVDLKQASMTLVADYRQRIFGLLGLALSAIALLLLATTRQPARVIWLLGTLLAALVVSIGVSRLLLGGLSLFDCIALALVAGLGLDYALFFSKRSDSESDRAITRRAIGLCALSSLFVFGVLALSSIPLLRGLGVTVASGVASAWLLARFGWRKDPT